MAIDFLIHCAAVRYIRALVFGVGLLICLGKLGDKKFENISRSNISRKKINKASRWLNENKRSTIS